MTKGSVLNEEMRRNKVLHHGLRCLSLKIGGEIRKRNKKEEEKRVEVNPSPDIRMWSVITAQSRAYTKTLFLVNKGKKGKSKEKDHDDDDDDRVTTAIGDDFVILQEFESINLVLDESMWIIDSGVALHVTPRNEFFTSYTSSDFGVLKMGNDGDGVCDVCLQTNMKVQLWLRGVKHARDVRFNLIYVHMLDDGGYDNHFGYGKWKLTKGYASKIEECRVGKTRVSFKKHPPSRNLELLELVHYDIYGPLKGKSFSGALYFVTFIDDCSKKLWVYALKTKDQALVERQSSKKMKCINSDNGGEYCGPFDVYYKQQGIRHEKTPPKMPQLNDLVERMNMTLI
ncbi:hypothetical protein CR513_56423, partial [Mucuna pruriens]